MPRHRYRFPSTTLNTIDRQVITAIIIGPISHTAAVKGDLTSLVAGNTIATIKTFTKATGGPTATAAIVITEFKTGIRCKIGDRVDST